MDTRLHKVDAKPRADVSTNISAEVSAAMEISTSRTADKEFKKTFSF